MGCLVNPTSFRLGSSRFWVSKGWFLKKNYSLFLFKDLLVYNYIYSFFYFYNFKKYFFNFGLVDINISRIANRAFINLFFYKVGDTGFKTYNYINFLGFLESRIRYQYQERNLERLRSLKLILKRHGWRLKKRNRLLRSRKKQKVRDIRDGKRFFFNFARLGSSSHKMDFIFKNIFRNFVWYRFNNRNFFFRKAMFFNVFFVFPHLLKIIGNLFRFSFFSRRTRFFDILRDENFFLKRSLRILINIKYNRSGIHRIFRKRRFGGLPRIKLFILRRRLLRIRRQIFRNRFLFFHSIFNFKAARKSYGNFYPQFRKAAIRAFKISVGTYGMNTGGYGRNHLRYNNNFYGRGRNIKNNSFFNKRNYNRNDNFSYKNKKGFVVNKKPFLKKNYNKNDKFYFNDKKPFLKKNYNKNDKKGSMAGKNFMKKNEKGSFNKKRVRSEEYMNKVL